MGQWESLALSERPVSDHGLWVPYDRVGSDAVSYSVVDLVALP